MDDLERVVARSRRLVGCLAPDVPPGVDVASWVNVSRFVEATGDENPLYTDVRYGASSSHHTMLAPPTFVLAVRMPDSAGALDAAPHRLVATVTALQLLWDDNVRLGDRLHGRVSVTAVTRGHDRHGRRSARVLSSATYHRNDAPFARCRCEVGLYPLDDDAPPFPDRPLHRYGSDEIDEMVERLEGETAPRGDVPRFWSETEVGDALPPLLKGPLTFSDLLVWKVAEARPLKAGNLHHHDLARAPGRCTVNPITGWPAWDRTDAWIDSATAGAAGLPAPAAHGGLLLSLAGQLVSHWMGDDGFLRRLSVEISRPLLYGDALTLSGTVVDRFTVTDEAAHRYHAVLVEIAGRNQLEELVLEGEAIVLLPDPGRPVALPVRGGLSCAPPGAS